MERVFESCVRLASTTAAVGGASAETDEEESPEWLHPVKTTRQIATRTIAAAVGRDSKNEFLHMATVTR